MTGMPAPDAPSGSGVVLSGPGGEPVVHITVTTSRSPPRGSALTALLPARRYRFARSFIDPAAMLPATFSPSRNDPEGPTMSHSRLSATVRVATVTTPQRTSTPGRPFVPYNRLPVRRWW